MSVDENPLVEAVGRAALLRRYCFGLRPGAYSGRWDPVYPYHRAPRLCPFCDKVYRRHAGFADHRDRCEEGPNPGANPAGPDGGADGDPVGENSVKLRGYEYENVVPWREVLGISGGEDR